MASITLAQDATSSTTLISSITSLPSSSSAASSSPLPTSSIFLTNSNCTTANSTYNNATGTCNNVNLNLSGWDWTYMVYIIPGGIIVVWVLLAVCIILFDKVLKKRWIQRGCEAFAQLFVGMSVAVAKKRREKREKRVRKEVMELERRMEKAGRVAVEVL